MRKEFVKKRKPVVLLFIAAFVIWGIIAWKITVSLGKRTDKDNISEYRPPVEFAGGDTLTADYPDPFLKAVPQRKLSGKTGVRPAVFFSPGVVPPPVVPPDFLFRGILRQGGREYVLLESGGKREIVRVGHLVDGFRVGDAKEDSVVLVKGKERYILKR